MVKTHTSGIGPHDHRLSLEHQFLTFILAEQKCGIHLRYIQWILDLTEVKAISWRPGQVRGEVHIHEQVIPIVDLREQPAVEAGEWTTDNWIIVVQAGGSEMGIIVEEIVGMMNMLPGDIDRTPSSSLGIRAECIYGVGKPDSSGIPLVDIDKVMATFERKGGM